jgi:kumamolisin
VRKLRIFVSGVALILVVSLLLVPPVANEARHGLGVAVGGMTAILPALQDSVSVAKDLGPYSSSHLMVGVAFSLPDQSAADAYVAAVYTPGSPYYHHYLTPAEWRNHFAPSSQEYAAADQYYQHLGLRTVTTSDRLMLGVTGPSQQLSIAFHTSFENYSLFDGRQIFGPSQPVFVPQGLGISGVTGFSNLTMPQPAQLSPAAVASEVGVYEAAHSSVSANWSCISGTQPCDEPGYYGEYPLFDQGYTGAGIKVGIVDAYDSAETQSQLVTSLHQWAQLGGLPTPKENFLYPIPTTANLNTTASSGWGGETALDQDMVDMTAPGSTIDLTFASDSSFAVYEAVDFLVAHNVTQVISMSWGEPDVGTMHEPPQNPCMPYYSCNASWDGSYAFLHPVFAEAVAEGITPLAAAGDCGAADSTSGVATDYPASDPYVVGVGGTIPNATGSVYQGEVGWSGNGTNCTANTGGGGGGYAPWNQPWWQSGPGQLTKGLRGVPDVSADASDGTSQAAPMWAGWIAVADQIHGGGLGLIGPSLYSILRNSTAYKADFHDIVLGNNGYSAGPGWDPVTGIGTPIASSLLPALSGYRPPSNPAFNVTLTADPSSGASPLTALLRATVHGGTAPYSYDFVPGLYLGQWTNTSTLNYTYSTAGPYTAMVTVFDKNGNSSTSAPILVNVGGGVLALNVSESTSLLQPGQSVTFNATVTGGSLPYQLTYYYGDNSYGYNGTLSSTHVYGTKGTFCPTIIAVDSGYPQSAGVARPPCITVSPTANPVVISSFVASPANLTVGQSTLLNVTATGGVLPYTYVYSGLPSGCSTQNLSSLPCTPSTSGNYSVTVTVTDASGYHVRRTLTLTVKPAPQPLVIVSFTITPTTVLVNQTLAFAATVQGGVGPFTYNYTGLPKGCSSANLSQFSCRPSLAGNFSVTLFVQDASGARKQALSNVSVLPLPPVIVHFGASPANVTVGNYTLLTTQVSAGEAPLHYQYFGLPAGCTSLDSSVLKCSPTAPGQFTLRVLVTDALGRSAESNATLKVSPAPVSSGPSTRGISGYLLVILVLVVVIALAGVLLWGVHRRRKTQSTPPENAPFPGENWRT